jgi:HEAT repeat protein
MLKAEGDPLVKERMSLLFRYARSDRSGPALAELSRSEDPGDRRAAIEALPRVRSGEAVKALIDRASADPEPSNRERAIVGLGKSIAQPDPRLADATQDALNAIRSHTRPELPASIRVAAWDAFSFAPRLGEADRKYLQDSLRGETDVVVRQAIEGAYRRHAARGRAEADRQQNR